MITQPEAMNQLLKHNEKVDSFKQRMEKVSMLKKQALSIWYDDEPTKSSTLDIELKIVKCRDKQIKARRRLQHEYL